LLLSLAQAAVASEASNFYSLSCVASSSPRTKVILIIKRYLLALKNKKIAIASLSASN